MDLGKLLRTGKSSGKNLIIYSLMASFLFLLGGCFNNPNRHEKKVKTETTEQTENATETDYQEETTPVATSDSTEYVEPVKEPEKPVYQGVSENTKFLETEQETNFYSVGKDEIIFSQPIETKISKGDILVSGTTDAAPRGLLRKVTDVSADKKIISTEPVSLVEAIEEGNVEFTQILTPNNINSSRLNLIKGMSLMPVTKDFNFNIGADNVVLYDLDGDETTTHDQITATGDISFNSDFNLRIKIKKNLGLEYFLFKNTTTQNTRLELNAKIAVPEIMREVKVTEIPFPTYTIWIPTTPPFPLLITPKIDINIGINGELSPLTAIVTQNAEMTAGLSYDNGSWSRISSFSNGFGFEPPQASENMDAKTFIAPRLDILLYEMAGPFIDSRVFTRFQADLNKEPWWSLFGGMDVWVGARMEIFDREIASHEEKVIEYEKLLTQAEPMPLPVAYLFATPSKGIEPLEVLLDASGSTSGVGIEKYAFSFGDNTKDYTETEKSNDGKFDGKTRHIYAGSGNFAAKVTIEDFLGKTDSKSVGVIVEKKEEKKGKIAFVSGRDGNLEIYTMNPDGSEQKNLTNTPKSDELNPKWSPDGKKIAFVSGRDGNLEIYTMNPDGSEQKNLTNNPAYDGSPAWSPDGNKIAFVSYRDKTWEIYVIDADSSNQIRLTNSVYHEGSPSWSPDGSKIVFSFALPGSVGNIGIMNSDGTEQKNLTNNPAHDYSPTFSPDGKKIAFVSDRDENLDIYTMNADGTEQKNLTNNPSYDYSPTFSPDGKKIAFKSSRDGNQTEIIYTMNLDGSNAKRLTYIDVSYLPAWSPDGKKIAFVSYMDGDMEIYVIGFDGNNLEKLTNNDYYDGYPVWSPVPIE